MKKYILLVIFAQYFLIHPAFAQPANDNCSGAIALGTLPAPNPCTGASPGVGATSTFNLTTAGATAENPYIYQTGCNPSGSMSVPALDVWYTFTATAYNVTVN
ncbi:MAG TPA: hypothetical protein VNZ86_15735, partial [Bacteroidia bacterium]|nr:hypothetical protein [Bacteroidia bacterium]